MLRICKNTFQYLDVHTSECWGVATASGRYPATETKLPSDDVATIATGHLPPAPDVPAPVARWQQQATISSSKPRMLSDMFEK